MQIRFSDAAVETTTILANSVIARIVDQDTLPADLEPVLVGATKAARFAGRTGQVFDGFVARGDTVARVALAALAKPAARIASTRWRKRARGSPRNI